MRIVGILLAAGAGVRFGGGKLLARLPDGAMVGERACRNLVAAIPEVIAVVRPGENVLVQVLEAAGARVETCHEAVAGMGASLVHGVRAAIASAQADAVVIALADMPWIRSDTLAAVVAALARGRQVVVPLHQGKRGHPVGFGSNHFAALAMLRDDEGARDVIAFADSVHRIDVDDPGILRDVDTPADLDAAM